MGTRSVWNGSISFGLVNIPIKLFTVLDSNNEYSFNQLDEKGHKIQYKKWCPIEEREIPYEEIRKGYKIAKDEYVIIEKEDFDKIKAITTKTIDIKEFIDLKDFDTILIEKSYYVSPSTDGSAKKRRGKQKENLVSASNKAFRLFVDSLKETNKIAIGKVVLKDREHLVAIRPYQRGLIMHQLMFQEEITPINEIEGMPGSESSGSLVPIDEKELELGKMLIGNLTSSQFDVTQYSDEYAKELEKLVTAKSKGTTYKTEERNDSVDTSDNLIEALKASVQRSKTSKN
ncbi:Ku protein [Candidatus Nitrosocosmicus hydrocola]|uniref:Ku protein n=1 Tax=Candidatus Nitrosocosmicus hydrocola TaxID=1826872 RepID=UPI000B01D44D|nr:Ku protein [Candidatus Nitrosocosmicus hydrocola]